MSLGASSLYIQVVMPVKTEVYGCIKDNIWQCLIFNDVNIYRRFEFSLKSDPLALQIPSIRIINYVSHERQPDQ